MGEERHAAVKALLKHLPPDAKVAASSFLSTQVSARPNAYSLWLGVYDADWMVTPLEPHEFGANEVKRLRERLVSKEWGVVAIEKPFVISRQGHDTSLNDEVLRHIGRKRLPRGKRATGYFPRPPRDSAKKK